MIILNIIYIILSNYIQINNIFLFTSIGLIILLIFDIYIYPNINNKYENFQIDKLPNIQYKYDPFLYNNISKLYPINPNNLISEDQYKRYKTFILQEDKSGQLIKEEKSGQIKQEEKSGQIKQEDKSEQIKQEDKSGQIKQEEKSGQIKQEDKSGQIKQEEKSGQINQEEKSGQIKQEEKSGQIKQEEKSGQINQDKIYNSDTVQILYEKINELEKIIKNNNCNDNTLEMIKNIVEKNNYINSNEIIQNLLNSDLKYNNSLNIDEMQPMGKDDNTVSNKWNNSYTILNTDKWRPPLHVNKVCKQEKQCPVCPSLTSGYPLDLMEFDKSRYVMGPDNISINYIKKLNNPIKP